MKFTKIAFLFIGIFLLLSSGAYALNSGEDTRKMSPDSFPVPNRAKQLFYIQRDPNTNTIVYELNVDEKGILNEKSPVRAYWIRYPEGGGIKDLNYIQRTIPYRIDSKKLDDGSFELRAFAYNKHALYLKKDDKKQYRVYTYINGQYSLLNRIFVRIDGGSFWNPNVIYVEMRGKEVGSGKVVAQKIMSPKKTNS